MAESETTRKLMMMSARFVDQVVDGYRDGERYCFILGAGASVTSGIRPGTELAKEWQSYLRNKESKNPGYIQDCASEYEDWDYKNDVAPLFEDGYVPKSNDYFSFYDLRFAGTPVQAYVYLQREMEGARPSSGYHCLAVLLSDTKNHLVITTNFDTLVEDTLTLYNSRRPLVLGHESLAPFMGSTENRERTVVAKVHRDLFLHPKNRKREMDRLDENWEGALKKALEKFTPIVIGYAGGDNTLMGLLKKMDLGTVYWCTRDKEGDVDQHIRDFLSAQTNGHLVQIRNFDQIMQDLLDGFATVTGYEDADAWLSLRIARSKVINERQFNKFFDTMTSPGLKDNKNILDSKAQPMGSLSDGDIRRAEDIAKAIKASVKGRRALNDNDFDKALRHFKDAVAIEPYNAEYHEWLGTVFHYMEHYADALAESDEAVRLEPGVARHRHSRGVTLNEMGRHEEALAEYDEAVRLEPGVARYRDSRGATLHAMGRYDEALAESDEAVRLEPGVARYRHSRGVTLHEMGRYDEALEEKSEAVRLEPGSAEYRYSRGVTLHAMGRYDEALVAKDEAIHLEPNVSEYHRSRGVTLRAMESLDESLAAINRAIELEPATAINHGSRALTLRALGREEEAQAEEEIEQKLESEQRPSRS